MQGVIATSRLGRAGIVQLAVADIDPNPNQPRTVFDPSALEELAASIREYGVISPLSVRLHYGRYELVAGERRLRAARMAGLKKVPCVVLDVDMEESSMLAMVENVQRQDLNFAEEARGIANLIRLFDMSQEECARRLGRSQSAVANKLRLLRLPQDVLEGALDAGLTERHARALLRLRAPDEQRRALEYIAAKGLNVAQTDEYVDSLLAPPASPPPRRALILKDVRVFLNSLSHSLDVMKRGGIEAGMTRRETEDELIVTISIPKRK